MLTVTSATPLPSQSTIWMKILRENHEVDVPRGELVAQVKALV